MSNFEDFAVSFGEESLFNDISKKSFYNWLERYGYGSNKLKTLFDQKTIDTTEQNKFNNILKQAKVETKIPINEMILYFEDDLIKLNKILSMLDNSVMDIVKNELSKKHKIKIEKSSIYKLIY